MSEQLLRQYEPHECGEDGYPEAWHRPTRIVPDFIELPAIKAMIREQAGHRCQRCGHPYRVGEHGSGEWSPCDERCRHGGPFRASKLDPERNLLVIDASDARAPEGWELEAQWRILTVHHLDSDKSNCRWWNLVALDQRCHLRMQRAVVMDKPWHYEHTEWFRLYAAGFYAFKYLGEDLPREETVARLDELLTLERRFTQEALPI